MEITKKDQLFICKNQNKIKYVEFINSHLIRVFESKVDSSLVKLHLEKESLKLALKTQKILFADYQLTCDEQLHLMISQNGKIIYQDYLKDLPLNEQYQTNLHIDLLEKPHIYGLGDKASFLNHYGYEYISYNKDEPLVHQENMPSLYKSINYLLMEHNSIYYGLFFPSSYKLIFNIGKEYPDILSVYSEKEALDYFIIFGSTLEDISKTYASLVGKAYLVKEKMLGYQQSRWSYENEQEVLELASNFKKYQLPLDYIHLDIDYMEGYKDLVINKNNFPQMKALSKKLAQDDIGLVGIYDAGVKKEDDYFFYEYLKQDNHALGQNETPYVNVVWPGDAIFPNYFSLNTSNYITKLIENFIDEEGLSGIWCDMNEPSTFKGEMEDDVYALLDDGEKIYSPQFHNLYGEYMVRCVAQAFRNRQIRPYVITRAAFATTSPYSVCWNGDNQSLWSHLQVSLTQIMNMNLSNFAFDGVDIGGFMLDCPKELLIRFLEANIFAPFLRNHAHIHSSRQEPWAYDQECLEIYRKFLNLRYRFIPYLYDLCYLNSTNGTPLIRPLFYQYNDDPRVKEINDQIMIGPSLMLCPIINQGSTSRLVYFPQGTWIDYFTLKEYQGEQESIIHLDLDQVGLFVKKGSILPNFESLMHINKKKINTLVLDCRFGKGSYLHYEDDGETLAHLQGQYNLYSIIYDAEGVKISYLHHGYQTTYQKIKVIFKDETKEILISGREHEILFIREQKSKLQ